MATYDARSAYGGVWAALEEGSKINYRMEPGADYAEFNFFGAMEITVGMPEETIRRCYDLFGQC